MEEAQDHAVGVIPVYKNPEGEFLFCLVQHADGHWGFPKGHQEEGESQEETARRELREETGIKDMQIDRTRMFEEEYVFERGSTRYHKLVKYFLARVDSTDNATQQVFKGEIPEFRWLPYKEATAMLTFSGGKRLLEEVKEYLE